MTMQVYAYNNHDGYYVTHRSRSGLVSFLNNAPMFGYRIIKYLARPVRTILSWLQWSKSANMSVVFGASSELWEFRSGIPHTCIVTTSMCWITPPCPNKPSRRSLTQLYSVFCKKLAQEMNGVRPTSICILMLHTLLKIPFHQERSVWYL